MMMMIRSTELVLIEIIFYELVIVLSELLNLCTQLLINILLARNQHLLSPNPYLRISMFLALLYVMGLATAVPRTVTPISKYYSTDVFILVTYLQISSN
jgi:hypothetical protein